MSKLTIAISCLTTSNLRWFMDLTFQVPISAQCDTGDQWRDSSRKNEEMEPKQKLHPAVDVTGDGSKVRCCKEQYCIGTWGDSPDKNTGVGSHVLLQGNLLSPGIKPVFLKSPTLAAGFFTTSTTWEAPDMTVPCVCLPSGPVPYRFCCDLPMCFKRDLTDYIHEGSPIISIGLKYHPSQGCFTENRN